MRCKFCDKIDYVWPENYIEGVSKPIEVDTGILHNTDRCQELINNGKKVLNRICECLKKNVGMCMACGGGTCSYLGCYIPNHNCNNSSLGRI